MAFEVLAGDCREVMATLEAGSVDAIVTDPPYELGFMGKSWDASGVAFDPETWRHALRVLKPGGHLLAFSGSRTYHRMACAIEDAGFEIRDQIMWVYGSGFPKSHDVSKAIDGVIGKQSHGFNTAGGKENFDKQNKHFRSDYGYQYDPATEAARTWSGWGTALKPAHEPIVVARKPFKGTVAQNVLAHGTGALNIDGCRVAGKNPTGTWKSDSGRWPANFIHDGSDEVVRLFPETASGKMFPTHTVARRSIYGQNVECGFMTMETYGDSGSAARFFYVPKASKRDREDGLDGFRMASPGELTGGRKEGSAGLDSPRAGAGRTSGRSNHHPTVKPTDLMRYLCRLVTPPGGLVLDPFAGSGSTGRGAVLEGFRFIGIEMDAGYRSIAIARIESAERSSHGAS